MDWRVQMAETPFGKHTRQNFRAMTTMDFAASGRVSQPLPRVGYLARIHVHFSGTLNVVLGGGTAALDVLGPWNACNRVRVQANSGQDIYSVSGYGAYLTDAVMTGGWLYDPSYESVLVPYDLRVYSVPTNAGNNTWEFGYTIPIALSEWSELGLILLQNEMAQTTLAYEFNPVYSLVATQAPVLVTGAATATLTGTFTPTLEYFAVPADPAHRPDISWVHQIIEFTQPIGAVGDNTINLLRDNLYVQILLHQILNNAPNTADLDRLRLVINQSDTPIDFNNKPLLQVQRRWYHRDTPVGSFMLDFFNQGIPNYKAGERDLLNGRATSELQILATIASGAVLGSNASRFNYIARQLVQLTTPPSRQA